MKKIIFHSKLEKNNQKMLENNFWQDKSNSQKIIKEKKLYEGFNKSHMIILLSL